MKIKQIINKCQKFITEQLQNSQVKSIIFFSVIFLMAGLSIITVGLILIPDSNRSTAVEKKLETDQKTSSENNNHEDESSNNQNLDESPSLEIETDPNEENDLPNNNENNNSNNEQPSSSTTTNPHSQNNQNNNSSPNNSSSQSNNNTQPNNNTPNNNNSQNNNGSQNNNDTPKPSEGEGSTTTPTNPEPETPPELFSATCTKSGLVDVAGYIRSHLTEQITVNFRKDDETFYSAKFVASLELYELDYDIDTIKESYTKTFDYYQGKFKVSGNKAVFTDVTKAYIILDNLKYDNFYAGYGSVPANYKAFLSTFQSTNYLCQRDS